MIKPLWEWFHLHNCGCLYQASRFYLTRACVAWKRNPGSEMKFSQLAPLLSLLLRTYGDPELCCHFQEDCAGVGNLTHGVRLWHLQAGKTGCVLAMFKFFPKSFQYNSKNKLFQASTKSTEMIFRIQGDLQTVLWTCSNRVGSWHAYRQWLARMWVFKYPFGQSAGVSQNLYEHININ